MFRTFRRLAGRIAGTVVLALATQTAYAGQMDLAVMSGDMAAAVALDSSHGAGGAPVDRAAPPCCDGGAMNALACAASSDPPDAAVSGTAPIAGVAAHGAGGSFVALVFVSPRRHHLPVALAGSFPPHYILFRRFLS